MNSQVEVQESYNKHCDRHCECDERFITRCAHEGCENKLCHYCDSDVIELDLEEWGPISDTEMVCGACLTKYMYASCMVCGCYTLPVDLSTTYSKRHSKELQVCKYCKETVRRMNNK